MGFAFDELSNRVIAAAIEVHTSLGPGFLESVYQQALQLELAARGMAFEAQKQIPVRYRDELVGNHILDLLVEDRLVVELKAVARLDDIYYAQVRSYLAASGMTVGLLMNFNSPKLVIKRLVNSYMERADGNPVTVEHGR